MERRFDLWNRAVKQTRSPLIEMIGNRRVLIENHLGILIYSEHEIVVRVRTGCVCIAGTFLKLSMMSKEQLVITGCIREIKLEEECLE